MEQKFTLGVGGAVVRDGRLLLVHHTYGSKKWQIPGGYVKPHECAHESVVREVHEETGIHAKVDGGKERKNGRMEGKEGWKEGKEMRWLGRWVVGWFGSLIHHLYCERA